MSSDIQFGELEESQPQRELRPDQDAHFATAMVGDIRDDELLIFVDLDVQRDMEAHALSNTRVELGGVMLGRQLIDDQGRPFVVISDSLRAEHYEATKGSFKFTHETWSQITRQRDEFRPDLEMVGWYHTHPGWSVFLSGMDLFICNNFFNRPLDVALVIDPCEQDRGWFQWTESETPKTIRTGGFILTTGRYRQVELDQFACIYNKEPLMNIDPRYSGNALTGGSQPSVTVMENRKPVFELAVLGMLMMQFLLLSVLAWRMLTPAQSATLSEDQEKIAQLETQLEQLTTDQGRSMRESAYREVLSTLVANQTGDANLVDEFTQLKSDGIRMQANLEGQLALADKLKFERDSVSAELNSKNEHAEKLESQLVGTREKVDQLTKTNKQLEKLTGTSSEDLIKGATPGFQWWWLVLGGLVTTVLGGALGFIFAKRDDGYDDYGHSDERLRNEERSRQASNPATDNAFEAPVNQTEPQLQPQPTATEPANVAFKIDGTGAAAEQDSPANPPE